MMNLFLLDQNHDRAAQAYYAKHLTKIPLELSQVLSTAHRLLDGREDVYKATHNNHPISLFARESVDNYMFVFNHLQALFQEFHIRRGKIHGCEKLLPILRNPPKLLIRGGFSTPPNCTPYSLDVVESYRLYYMNEKRHLADFEQRTQPEWWE